MDSVACLEASALERVMRLHAQSLNKATENYRIFLSTAWWRSSSA